MRPSLWTDSDFFWKIFLLKNLLEQNNYFLLFFSFLCCCCCFSFHFPFYAEVLSRFISNEDLFLIPFDVFHIKTFEANTQALRDTLRSNEACFQIWTFPSFFLQLHYAFCTLLWVHTICTYIGKVLCIRWLLRYAVYEPQVLTDS